MIKDGILEHQEGRKNNRKSKNIVKNNRQDIVNGLFFLNVLNCVWHFYLLFSKIKAVKCADRM